MKILSLEGLCLLNLAIIILVIIIKEIDIRKTGLVGSWLIVFYVTLLCVNSKSNLCGFQYKVVYKMVEGFDLVIGVDGISLSFMLLTSLLIPVCILCSWTTIRTRLREFFILLFVLEFMLFGVFIVINLMWFYIFFEAVLIPMFLIIGYWGSRSRKVHAAYQFFLYTLLGSLFMLVGLFIIYYSVGTLNLEELLLLEFTKERQKTLWLLFFIAFAVKVPVVPFHIWLPEAHVEAPTAGSVLLAGILLKLGGYGFIRFSIPLFPYASMYFAPLVHLIGIVGVIYGSLATIRQVDMKKIIAYSSVAHMGFFIMGLFSFNVMGVEGSIVGMISHGLVSGGLFIGVGLLYERYGSRLLPYYGGLVGVMPIFSSFFFILTLANMGMPGTSSFVGEFLVLQGLFSSSFLSTFLAGLGMILGSIYSIWMFNRVFYGKIVNDFITTYSDLSRREVVILGFLVVLIIILGVYPNMLLEELHVPVLAILLRNKNIDIVGS